MLNVNGGVTTKKYIIETTGSGVAVIDYDNDGWPDIFLVNGTTLDAQLADLTAVVTAQGRAQSLESAQRASAQDQGREQLRRFLTPGQGYQSSNVQMFH